MSAEVRLDPVGYCDECAEAADWNEDQQAWVDEHNREYHGGTP